MKKFFELFEYFFIFQIKHLEWVTYYIDLC